MAPAASVDLDHFAQRGFVRIDGAIDPALTTRWREEALPRLRDRAADELKDSQPRSGPGDFATLDPDNPRTWRWRRATLRGSETARIEDVAPALGSALTALLGDRLHTRSFTNYLILSFPGRGLRRWLPRPPGGATSHHLDDPGPAMGLGGWRNAALLVLLFSDIAPGGGGPLLACDSPPRVARALANGGADFVSRDLTRSIVAQCSDLHEVTGKAGDALLLHPFLLHSPTANRSRRLRVLANPMLQARSELAFAPGTHARCPLEEITQSWLG